MSAFGLVRGVSVVVVLLALLTIAGGVVVLVVNLPSKALPPTEQEALQWPEMDAFTGWCASQLAPATRSHSPEVAPPQDGAAATTPGTRFPWPCTEVANEISTVVQWLQLDEVRGGDYICEWYREADADDRRAAIIRLTHFAKGVGTKMRESSASEPFCDGSDALIWFIAEDTQNRLARDGAIAARLMAQAEAEAIRAQRIDMAGLVIVSALGALLSFIFLPLLIQIERNTRRTS